MSEKKDIEVKDNERANQAESLVKQDSQSQLIEPDFVRMEKNLAAFGFFTPSSKRINNVPKVIKFSQTINGNRVEAEVKIFGHIQYGMPITADQDKYLAFQKIVERVKREKGAVTNPITFSTAELIKLLGRADSGSHYNEVLEWLKVMKGATIESTGAVWIAGKKKHATDVFSIFDRIRSIGDELDDGTTADKNYVWLSSWYLENLNAHYLLPIDFDTYKQLKNHVAKALVPLLQVWLYASREQAKFEKRYSEICQTLNIKVYSFSSDIKRFFGNSLDELVEHGYLRAWEIEKTADNRDFKIIFYHGVKFYQDRVKRLRGKKITSAKKNDTLRSIKTGNDQVSQPAQNLRLELNSEGLTYNQSCSNTPPELPANLTDEEKNLIRRLNQDFEIVIMCAYTLVKTHLQAVKDQIEAWPFRKLDYNNNVKNKAGWMIAAIENNYQLPQELVALQREQSAIGTVQASRSQIAECQLCDQTGYRFIYTEKHRTGAMKKCTHDTETENRFSTTP